MFPKTKAFEHPALVVVALAALVPGSDLKLPHVQGPAIRPSRIIHLSVAEWPHVECATKKLEGLKPLIRIKTLFRIVPKLWLLPVRNEIRSRLRELGLAAAADLRDSSLWS